jgi:hypothetical protein
MIDSKKFDCIELQRAIRNKNLLLADYNLDKLITMVNQRTEKSILWKKLSKNKELEIA